MEKSTKKNFWLGLPKPFMIMAPMADVTDSVFRRVIAEQGKPVVMYTEFVSADGLTHQVARDKLLFNLDYSEAERPIVAQIFSGKRDKIEAAARLCKELGFDGIDINMGCPDRGVEKQGAGAAMIKNPKIAKTVIQAAKRGANGLPVSVKTRLGYRSTDEMDDWVDSLLEAEPACLIMHLRTRNEMSKVDAHWELASRLISLRDAKGVATLIAANGNVKNLNDAREKAQKYKLDGIMLGRAIFGNPWLFFERKRETIPWDERLQVMLKHTKLFEDTYIKGPKARGQKPLKNFHVMRKFYGAYVAGHPYGKKLRQHLMTSDNYADVKKIVESI